MISPETITPILRFEQAYLKEAKIDKVSMQRHKIACVVAFATGALFITSAFVVVSLASGGALAVGALVISGIAIDALFLALSISSMVAFSGAIYCLAQVNDIKNRVNLRSLNSWKTNFDATKDRKIKKRFTLALDDLIRYGLTTPEIASKITDFKKRFNKKDHTNEERIALDAEWATLIPLIRDNAPYSLCATKSPIYKEASRLFATIP